ncbi:hypothetical protein SPRG_19227 [Saprolegnia parasitica CBS 223.65]|uniref:WW domain-containing protein n=1 Tax=Saprolegnia parasitica (strain CBS 223.65) TaxID=695850 RepID=A0A067CWG8_SAPPC|nr:hypothetical protein SPRG_19227 [Saprolegnia parasitica CBS 223.65]KDO33595.1 hypothetical protein SPRG_19227 [Saprolegnia parasitica CBS 223.65]|eukprot:XP_012195647.1 hypothetical protein SPRG_19227 [Saprolegnia parasitica CBS 223.65]
MDEASGKPYYYHSGTKQCVWDEPEEYRIYKARVAVRLRFSDNVVTASPTNSEPMDMTPDETPIEEAPATATAIEATTTETATDAAVAVPTEPTEPTTATNKDDEEDDIAKYAAMSKADQVAAFKAMLKTLPITPKMKWGDAQRLIADEPAWYALPTNGEKKQAYSEFLTQLTKELDLARRRQQKVAREDFLKLLASCKKISVHTRWHEATTDDFGLIHDDRFKAVADDDERRELFLTFLDDMARSEREYARKKRDEHKATILAYYASPELAISAESRWVVVRDVVFKDETIMGLGVAKRDLEDFFFEYLDSLKKAAAEAQRLARIKARETEDALAAAFRAYLQDEIAAKRLTLEMRWRDCLERFEANESFVALRNANTILARDVFEMTMDKWHATVRDERQWLHTLLERNGFRMQHKTTLRDCLEQLQHTIEPLVGDDPRGQFYSRLLAEATVPESVLNWFHTTQRAEVERAERVAAAKKQKLDAFTDLLTEFFFRSDHLDVPWDDARRLLEGRSRFRAMGSDAKAAFDAYMTTLRAKMQQVLKTRKLVDAEEGEVRASRSRDRKRRKRSRSSSSSSTSSRSPSSSSRKRHKKSSKKKSKKHSKKTKKRSRSRSKRRSS